MYVNARRLAALRTTIGAMNRDHCEGLWKQASGSLKEQWGALTNDPATRAAGRRDRLDGRIQAQCAVSKQAAERQLEEFMHRNRRWWDLSGG